MSLVAEDGNLDQDVLVPAAVQTVADDQATGNQLNGIDVGKCTK